MNRRRLGKLLGLVVLLGVVGIVGYGLVNRARSSESTSGAALPQLDAPPNSGIAELPGDGGSVQDIIDLAEEAAWTRVDPTTGEVRAKMEWDHMEPREQGLFLIDSPRAWMIDEQRVIIVTGAVGTVVWPSRQQEPESGRLEGEVMIRVFDQVWEGASESLAAPAGVEPALTFMTPALQFNTTFGEVATSDAFTAVGPGIDASGEGLALRFSTEPGMPITFLRIERDLRAELREHTRSDDGGASAASNREDAADESPGAETDPGVTAFYQASLDGGVDVLVGGRTLRSESASIFARLEDGRLPEGALASFNEDPSTTRDDDASGAEDRAAQSEAEDDSPSSIQLRCLGAMELKLQEDRPPALTDDDLFVRFQSPRGQTVRLTDAASKSTVDCMSLEYGATRRFLTLFGIGPVGVVVMAPQLVELNAGRMDLDMTTGIGAISTPGSAIAKGEAALIDDPAFEPGERPRELRWSERLDFVLDTSRGPVGSGGRVIPRSVRLSGRVEAHDGLSHLKGDVIEAFFDEPQARHDGSAPSVTLERLEVAGRAEAQEPDGGRVLADQINVDFAIDPDDGRVRPTLALAQGNVRGTRQEQTLRAGLVEVRFGKSPGRSQVGVDSLEARLGVEVTVLEEAPTAEPGRQMLAPARITIQGDRLLARNDGALIDIMGEPARITRTFGDENSEIEGPLLNLENVEDSSRMLVVDGEGSAQHRFRRPRSEGFGEIQIEFSEGLRYDDVALEGEAWGDVIAQAEFGDSERHLARGERISLEMMLNEARERELARAIVHGQGFGQTPAEIELRRFRGAPDLLGARALESMAFLRGETISLDAPAGLLHVPKPGLLLLEDRRAADQDPSQEPDPSMRGTTLLEWQGEMRLDRARGTGTMRGRAQLRHRDPEGAVMTEIESERMDVGFDWPDDASAGVEDGLTVREATASGAVFVRRGTLELVCDLLRYDAETGIVTAIAEEGNRITVYDDSQSRHVQAEAIELNIATGAWGRITRPSGVLIPR